MRKTVIKTFWAWNFDKEEKWLNEMASKGLVLVSVGFCKYTFEECTPGEYNIRLELLENLPSHAESQHYIEFIEETGAQYLGSLFRWIYFRSKTENGEFNLYSDTKSRIKQLNRVLALLVIISCSNVCIGISNISVNGFSSQSMMGLMNVAIGLFIAYGILRICLKRRKLKKRQDLFE